MIWFEWKKILNGRVLLCFVVIHLAFLMLFWTQNSSDTKGKKYCKAAGNISKDRWQIDGIYRKRD